MNVKLLNATPLYLISNAIRYSHDNHNLSDSAYISNNVSCPVCGTKEKDSYVIQDDKFICFECEFETPIDKHIGKKDFDLIKRVGFHMNHSSTLEHSILMFDVELSTKALLEWTRSRIGVAYTVTSSRYSLDKMGINVEKTGNEEVDKLIEEYTEKIKELLVGSKKSDFDKLAMLLPQSFMYKMQVSFNLRSLIHFLELRTHKSAHKTIRKLAIEILNVLKDKEPMYFELLMENEKIKYSYMAETVDLESYRRPVVKLVRVGDRK